MIDFECISVKSCLLWIREENNRTWYSPSLRIWQTWTLSAGLYLYFEIIIEICCLSQLFFLKLNNF